MTDTNAAYLRGFNDFEANRPCPFAEGPEAREWWRGWQAAAQLYLEAEFAKAAEQ